LFPDSDANRIIIGSRILPPVPRLRSLIQSRKDSRAPSPTGSCELRGSSELP